MATKGLNVNGAWPDLAGLPLDQLLAQESWFDGELDDEANVIWICAGGTWHKFYFDGDTVCWRAAGHAPASRDGFPMNDLGAKHGLVGANLLSCEGAAIKEGVSVTFRFANGVAITFRHRYDTTTIQVG